MSMHLRRIACFLLGGWLLGGLYFSYILARNASSAGVLLGSPHVELQSIIKILGEQKTRDLLLYQASELNRSVMLFWGRAQLLIGLVLIAVLALSKRVHRAALILCGAMIVLAAFSHLVLTPEIEFFTRAIDFTPAWAGNRGRLSALRTVFVALDFLKLSIGSILAVYMFRAKDGHVIHREPLRESLAVGR